MLYSRIVFSVRDSRSSRHRKHKTLKTDQGFLDKEEEGASSYPDSDSEKTRFGSYPRGVRWSSRFFNGKTGRGMFSLPKTCSILCSILRSNSDNPCAPLEPSVFASSGFCSIPVFSFPEGLAVEEDSFPLGGIDFSSSSCCFGSDNFLLFASLSSGPSPVSPLSDIFS